MKSKVFLLMLVAVLAVGIAIGGAFVGGLSVGKAQAKERAATSPATSSASTSGQRLSGQQPSGQLSQEQLQQLRQQFQGQAGRGEGGFSGLAGRGGLTGTVEKVEGNTVTVTTPQGPLAVVVGSDTVIQKFATGSIADLQIGTRVTVAGERDASGNVKASAITLIPQGQGGMFGGGQSGAGRQP